jgi:hypothetical protein
MTIVIRQALAGCNVKLNLKLIQVQKQTQSRIDTEPAAVRGGSDF